MQIADGVSETFLTSFKYLTVVDTGGGAVGYHHTDRHSDTEMQL